MKPRVLRVLILITGLTLLVLPHQNCKKGGPVSPTPTPSQGSLTLMEKVKQRGCVTSGIVFQMPAINLGADWDKMAAMLARSECLYYHRSIETWETGLDFQQIDNNIQTLKTRTGKDLLFEVMFAECIDTQTVLEFPDENRNFNFSQMCQAGTTGSCGGANSCRPSFYQEEYRKYLKYTSSKLMDLGVQSFYFGEVQHQDPDWWKTPEPEFSASKIVAMLKDVAQSKNKKILIGAQISSMPDTPNDSRVVNYFKVWDFSAAALYQSASGEVDWTHSKSVERNMSLLYNSPYPEMNNNVVIFLDWWTLDDDVHRFGKLNQEQRKALMRQVWNKLKERKVAFLLPFLSPYVGGNLTTECSYPTAFYYAPDKNGTCAEEDVFNELLLGGSGH